MIKIEKGIPIPPKRKGAIDSKYPWKQLEPGDSFFVPGASNRKFASAVAQARKRYGLKLTCRSVEGGVRVWRLPDEDDQ